jgi:adenosylhomocysteine nucleosidase
MSTVNTRVAIIAALPREIAELVRGKTADNALRQRGVYLYRLPKAVVLAAGMGAERVEMAVKAALAEGALELIVSAGLAGACSPDLQAGDVAEAGVVVDGQSGIRYPTSNGSELVLVSAPSIASIREKTRLSRSYLATMVDMEAATVARLAAEKNIAFRAIKGISDAHDFELEGLSQFTGAEGKFRTAAFAAHTAVRPRKWSKAMKLGRNSKQALAALSVKLRQIIAES